MKTIDMKEWAIVNFSNKKPHAPSCIFPCEDKNTVQENIQVDLKIELSGDNCSWEFFCVPVHISTESGKLISKESSRKPTIQICLFTSCSQNTLFSIVS